MQSWWKSNINQDFFDEEIGEIDKLFKSAGIS